MYFRSWFHMARLLRGTCKLRFSLFDRAIIPIFAFPTIICVWLIVNNSRHRCSDSRWLRIPRKGIRLRIPRKGIRGRKCALLRLMQSRRNWTITSVRENARPGSCRLCESVIDALRLKWSTIECSVLFWLKSCNNLSSTIVQPYIIIQCYFFFTQ